MKYYPIQMFHYAAQNDSSKIKEILIHFPDYINETNSYGDTPAMIAAKMKYFDLMFYMIEQGADINLKNKEGKNVFSYVIATSFNLTEKKIVLKKLMDLGAQVESVLNENKKISSEVLNYIQEYKIMKQKEYLEKKLIKKPQINGTFNRQKI